MIQTIMFFATAITVNDGECPIRAENAWAFDAVLGVLSF
jgi:hypothetical protein